MAFYLIESESEFTQLCPTLCNTMDCSLIRFSVHGFSGKNTGVGCHFLLQEIFQTQEWNPSLLLLDMLGAGGS